MPTGLRVLLSGREQARERTTKHTSVLVVEMLLPNPFPPTPPVILVRE